MDTEGEGYPRKVDIPQRGKPQFVDSIMRLQDRHDNCNNNLFVTLVSDCHGL